MKDWRFGYLAAFAIFFLMWWLARLPAWSSHLQVDVWISWLRVSYFFEHGQSFAGMMGNEILPATLLYILLPVALVPVGWLSYQTYLPATLILNMLPLVATWLVVKNRRMYLSFLLLLGPILLFRFDGVVVLLMVLSFLAFTKDRHILSAGLLGLATGMKVFPVLFLPYLVLLLYKDKNYRKIAQMLAAFAGTLLVPVISFMLMGGNYAQVEAALAFHSQKLISIESIPGSIITGWSLITAQTPPPLIPGNGIWSVPGPHTFFNKLWLLPILAIYLWLYWKKHGLQNFRWEVPLAMMLVFLGFSKNLNPQYVWWFLVFLPFIKTSYWLWGLGLIVALTNQLVYPLFYSTFIDDFYRLNSSYWIYLVLLLRNLAIICMMLISVYLIGCRAGDTKNVEK